MTDTPEPDTEGYAEAMAAALDLPLDEEFLPGVTANLDVAFQLASLFLGYPLADDAEPAPVFRP